LTPTAHKTAQQNQVISWIFSPSDSNGKEKDWESGFHYYGARYFWSEVLTGWLSVDPMMDKYPSISPYAYCMWNPIKLVDHVGRDVHITGDDDAKTEAVRQIQQKSKNMIFSIDKNGKLTYEGKAKTRREKYMEKIIKNENIHVNLSAQDHSNNNGEKFDIGGFGGSRLSEDGNSVNTYQCINIVKSQKQDRICNNPGNMIWHEIAESYEGGIISVQTGVSAPAATNGNDKTIYRQAHYSAGKYFPGTITDGTLRGYVEKLPDGVRGHFSETYLNIHGDKQKTWYSR
jgi:RHS repeat-associated protein